MHLLSLLYACDPSAVTPPSSDPPVPVDPTDPAPWTFTTESSAPPDPDLDALATVIETAAPAILEYDAEPVLSAYDALYASATPTCPPTTLDPYGNTYWYGGCAAPDGTYFGGFLAEYAYVDTYDPYSAMYYDGDGLSGNITLDGPAGVLDLEGSATWVTGRTEDGSVQLVESALAGGFYFDQAKGWLGDSTSAAITLVGYTIPIVGGKAVVIDGAVPVEVHGDRYDVVFHATGMANLAAGSLCADEPGGSVDVRDPWGRWVSIAFQGPVIGYDGGDPDHCDGCGDATLDGASIGQVCADFTPLFQWEKLP